MAIVSGNPAIAYYVEYADPPSTAVKYVRASSSSGTGAGDWSELQTLDTIATTNSNWVYLTVVNGNPAIVYMRHHIYEGDRVTYAYYQP